MKTIILTLLITLLPLTASAQCIQGVDCPAETPQEASEVQPAYPFADLNNSQFTEDQNVAALLERAARENHFDAIDGRFGGQKPLTYYVDQRAAQAAKDELLRQQQPFNQMLNDALQKEDEIRAQLLDLQGHYSFAQKTINAQFIHLWHLESVIEKCKRSKGRRCN